MNWMQSWLATVAALTLAIAQPASQEHPLPSASPAPATPADRLYSKRALRRARLIIEMQMLELREERLECVRSAILRRLPPELRPSAPGGNDAEVKQTSAPGATPGSVFSNSEDCTWLSTQRLRRKRTV